MRLQASSLPTLATIPPSISGVTAVRKESSSFCFCCRAATSFSLLASKFFNCVGVSVGRSEIPFLGAGALN